MGDTASADSPGNRLPPGHRFSGAGADGGGEGREAPKTPRHRNRVPRERDGRGWASSARRPVPGPRPELQRHRAGAAAPAGLRGSASATPRHGPARPRPRSSFPSGAAAKGRGCSPRTRRSHPMDPRHRRPRSVPPHGPGSRRGAAHLVAEQLPHVHGTERAPPPGNCRQRPGPRDTVP